MKNHMARFPAVTEALPKKFKQSRLNMLTISDMWMAIT
jgi:hypothetical protein